MAERRPKRIKETQPDTPGIGANYDLPEAEKSIEIYDKMEAYQKDDQQVAEIAEVDVNDTTQLSEGKLKSFRTQLARDNTLLDENADQGQILGSYPK